MKEMAAPRLAALFAVFAGGCGTISTFVDGEPRVYGGVKRDYEWLQDFVNGSSSERCLFPSDSSGQPPDPRFGLAVIAAVGLIEPPLSFVADTLTLPITYFCERKNADPEVKSIGTAAPENHDPN